MSTAISLELLAFNLKLLGRQRRKNILISAGEAKDKKRMLPAIRRIMTLDVDLYATPGTHRFFDRQWHQVYRNPQDHRQPLAQHPVVPESQPLRPRHQRPDRRRRLRRKLGRQAHPQALDRKRHSAHHRLRCRHRDARTDHRRQRARHLPLQARRRQRAVELALAVSCKRPSAWAGLPTTTLISTRPI